MKKITFLLSLLITSVGFCQEVLQDFESGGPRDPFGGASFSLVSDPEAGGSRGQVALLTASASGQFFQGINIDLTENVELTSNKTMTMDVFSNEPITIAPKVVSGVSGAPDSTTSASHTGNGWETLSFTFDKGYDNTTTANGTYRVLVVYYLWEADNSGFINPAIDRTFYVDNISGTKAGEAPADPEPTDAPPTPPNFAPENVISLYSEAYTPATVISNVTYDDSEYEEITVAGNDILKVTGTNFLGISLADYLNATEMTRLHIDYWIGTDYAPGQVLNPKLSNHANQAGETSAIDISNPIESQAEVKNWQSKDFDLSGARESIKEFLITVAGRTSVYYLDNVYLYKQGTASIDQVDGTLFKVYPNPTNRVWNIESLDAPISSVAVYDITGKLVIDQKESANTVSIDASSLSQGLYIAKISSTSGEVRSIKLTKN